MLPHLIEGKKTQEYVSIVCNYCNKTHSTKVKTVKEAIKAGKTVLYCSPKCYTQSTRNRKSYECSLCGKEFSRVNSQVSKSGNLYCSNSCAAKVNNKKFVKKKKTLTEKRKADTSSRVKKDKVSKKVTVRCGHCGEGFLKRAYDASRVKYSFCPTCLKEKTSSYLRSQLEQVEYIKLWKQGLKDGMGGKSSIHRYLRRYLIELHNNQCCKCKWKEVNVTTGKVPLEVNHIDGNFRNNDESNLEILCPNCHSLTPTYRALNMGNGRPR